MKFSKENVIAEKRNEFSAPYISQFLSPMQSRVFLLPEAFIFIVLVVLFFLIKKNIVSCLFMLQ